MTNGHDSINTVNNHWDSSSESFDLEERGLTKREMFAAMAMQGMLAGITKFREDIPGVIVNRPDDISEIACCYADTLISVLNGGK